MLTAVTPIERQRVLHVFRTASVPAFMHGSNWYMDANDLCSKLLGGGRERKCAGLLAAASPNKSWPANIAAVYSYLGEGVQQVTDPQWVKMQEIMAGGDPEHVLKGHKELAFYKCIRWPDAVDTVCIDRHAVAIVDGWNSMETPRSMGSYDRYANVYRSVAAELGLVPMQVQAITWLAWRESPMVANPVPAEAADAPYRRLIDAEDDT